MRLRVGDRVRITDSTLGVGVGVVTRVYDEGAAFGALGVVNLESSTKLVLPFPLKGYPLFRGDGIAVIGKRRLKQRVGTWPFDNGRVGP